jgi:hypothetical protein
MLGGEEWLASVSRSTRIFLGQAEQKNGMSGTWLVWSTLIFNGQAEQNMVGNKQTNNYLTSFSVSTVQ